jgi:hypothetical protein
MYRSANFSVFISVITISTVINSTGVSVIEVGTGKLQVSLSWDKLDDVDLILVDPNGEQIYFARPFAFEKALDPSVWSEYHETFAESNATREERKKFFTSRGYKIVGELDLDSNAACRTDGVNNENITYETVIVPGTYQVLVNLWAKCTDSYVKGSTYSVTVNNNGTPLRMGDQQVGKFTDNNEGNPTLDIDQLVRIGTFTIGGSRSTASPDLKPFTPEPKK